MMKSVKKIKAGFNAEAQRGKERAGLKPGLYRDRRKAI
jgi:hypothetical protein